MESAKEKAETLVSTLKAWAFYDSSKSIAEAVASTLKIGKILAHLAVEEILRYQPYDVYSLEQSNNVNIYWADVKKEIDLIQ